MAGYIVDNSVWGRIKVPEVRQAVEGLTDVIYTVTPQRLEFLYSAASQEDFDRQQQFLDAVGVYLEPADDLNDTCEDIQRALATHGKLRSVGPVDVMIAAYAYRHRLTVLHYDSDFSDHIAASIQGFQQEWVVPRGSL
ncbi:PIN domain-containing protein [Cellulosimicrobium cellulans]|uniref:PIN domain-containing protein n=1 Tax=Cellulosimicrobium cellulans TaxID=1710 RepID=UPI001EDBE8AE|nr:PIN domain-containing protein [Cellulosimicrobium cellulans]UKJ62797.1 PIN domain-containing protein [Cellulosimicrobium cellulans]